MLSTFDQRLRVHNGTQLIVLTLQSVIREQELPFQQSQRALVWP